MNDTLAEKLAHTGFKSEAKLAHVSLETDDRSQVLGSSTKFKHSLKFSKFPVF